MSAIVGPTLIFYVVDLGGSKNEYGMMISIVSLASILMIPVYGKWVDSNGSKYKPPYITSFILGIISALIYFGVVLLPNGPVSVYCLTFSRFLSGMSIAGRTLSYSWVASSIVPDKQRNIYTFLSMSRTMGLVLGPIACILVSEVDTEFNIFGLRIPVDPNNSVGLVMLAGEVILVILTLLVFQDPPEKENPKKRKSEVSSASKAEVKGVLHALSYFDISFPVFTMFAIFGSLQLLFTGMSPVARNIGWNPVEISEVTAYGSAIMAVSMVVSMFVSMSNVSDTIMISFGVGLFFLSGSSMYLFWMMGASYWEFTVPCYLMFVGYPFIGPANRSRYAKAIHGKKELEGSHGIMMSLINQATAFSGLIAPTLIASFVIRTKAAVDTGSDKRALTAGALYVPLLCIAILVGLFYNYHCIELPDENLSENDTDTVSESTTLLPRVAKRSPRASLLEISDTFSKSSEVCRRMSVEVMGIPNPVETKYEKELNEQLRKDEKLWEELEALDSIEDQNKDDLIRN